MYHGQAEMHYFPAHAESATPGPSLFGDTRRKVEKPKAGKQSFSCAECRRLKLKCNRVWPCESCEKRGCAQICPKGEMRTGKGKRLILADTEELHQRISLLEVALAQAHAQTSTTPHRLLNSSHLYAPRDTSKRTKEAGLTIMEDEEDIIEGGLGTLTIGDQGEARYVGGFAGSEYLNGNGGESDSPDEAAEKSTGMMTPPPSGRRPWTERDPGVVGGMNIQGLLGGTDVVGRNLVQLRKELPDWESEGRQLVDNYWKNVNWMYQILPRPMFDGDHLLNAYDTASPANAHKLACVFFIMALGVMFDLDKQPFNRRGEELFVLGRACLSVVGLEHSSPATIQALHLCGTYILNDKHGNGAEMFWPILGTAVKVAQSLGLHRDGAAFGLSSYEVEERRQVWWELVTYDRLQALCFGRPYATSNRSSDTKFPEPSEGLSADADGYHRAKYQLIQMMERIIDIQTQITPVSIQQVLALDKEFKDFKDTVPESLMPKVAIHLLPFDSQYHPHVVIHRLGIRLLVAQSRLLLNRPTFARALRDDPEDPSQGKLGESFMALFESAQEIVQLVKQLVLYHPSLVARWWFFWFHAFTSSVCLAAIAIHAPSSAFASPAFHGMTIVCDIAAAARPGCRAKRGLPILLRLRRRASAALSAAGKMPRVPSTTQEMGEEDDLSHLHTSVKLRRVVESPPRKRNTSLPSQPSTDNVNGSSLRESTIPSDFIDNSSPASVQSIATSTTLAEPVYHVDLPGPPIRMPFNPDGAVQPPPPPPGQSTGYPTPPNNQRPTIPAPIGRPEHIRQSSGQYQPVDTQRSVAHIALTANNSSPIMSDSIYSVNTLHSSTPGISGDLSGNNVEFDDFMTQWQPQITGTSPVIDGSPAQASGDLSWLYNVDMDISMALGLGGSGTRNQFQPPTENGNAGAWNMGNDDGGTGEDFDFEMFVTQLGGNDGAYE